MDIGKIWWVFSFEKSKNLHQLWYRKPETQCLKLRQRYSKLGSWSESRLGFMNKIDLLMLVSVPCSMGIHHAEPRISERLLRCMTRTLSQNNLHWMWLLGCINRDTWRFSRVGAAFARIDKDRSDSCSMGIHHAEPRITPYSCLLHSPTVRGAGSLLKCKICGQTWRRRLIVFVRVC